MNFLDIEKIEYIPIDKVELVRQNKKQAAVIVPLLDKKKEWSILFEKRPDNGSLHGGQISFPGGSIETSDKNILTAALRETQEEIGINSKDIRVVGALKPIITLTSDFVVYPFVGILKKYDFHINTQEVSKLFNVPLSYLMEKHPFKEQSYIYRGKEHSTFIIKYDGETIWGATARIIDEFIDKVVMQKRRIE